MRICGQVWATGAYYIDRKNVVLNTPWGQLFALMLEAFYKLVRWTGKRDARVWNMKEGEPFPRESITSRLYQIWAHYPKFCFEVDGHWFE